jgi:hypothetical protein
MLKIKLSGFTGFPANFTIQVLKALTVKNC